MIPAQLKRGFPIIAAHATDRATRSACHTRATTTADVMHLARPFAACCRFPGDVSHLADERAQSLRDRLVAVTRGVLVDHRGTDAGVPEARHQLFERGARCGREGAARVPKVVKMKFRHGHHGARFGPDRLVEVRAAQPAALRADKDESPLPPARRTAPGAS